MNIVTQVMQEISKMMTDLYHQAIQSSYDFTTILATKQITKKRSHYVKWLLTIYWFKPL